MRQSFPSLDDAVAPPVAASSCSYQPQVRSTLRANLTVGRRAGMAPPGCAYEDAICLAGRTMSITRSGGPAVVAGSWTVILDEGELARLNAGLARMSAAVDGDRIAVGPRGPFPVGGGHERVLVDGTGLYRNGEVLSDGLHVFAAEVQACFDLVVALMAEHDLDVAYVAQVA